MFGVRKNVRLHPETRIGILGTNGLYRWISLHLVWWNGLPLSHWKIIRNHLRNALPYLTMVGSLEKSWMTLILPLAKNVAYGSRKLKYGQMLTWTNALVTRTTITMGRGVTGNGVKNAVPRLPLASRWSLYKRRRVGGSCVAPK